MATEDSIVFRRGGKAQVLASEEVSVPALPVPPQAAANNLDRITEMILDEEALLSDIMRLIAHEIARTMKMMTAEDPLARGGVSQRDLNDRVKAYRELQKTLTESDQLSKKDSLNMDGPKFKFVLTEIMRMFQKALKESGVTDDLARNIMLQFGDLVKSNDETLRRELGKL